jgi:hypothetical protein
MARVGRIAGALLVETTLRGESAWFVVGDTKVPCDWCAAGFRPTEDRDPKVERYARLVPAGAPSLAAPTLQLSLEGEAAVRLVAERLLIARNGAVSDRLWRLIVGDDDSDADIDARWLSEMPARVWDAVRDAVLKCT